MVGGSHSCLFFELNKSHKNAIETESAVLRAVFSCVCERPSVKKLNLILKIAKSSYRTLPN